MLATAHAARRGYTQPVTGVYLVLPGAWIAGNRMACLMRMIPPWASAEVSSLLVPQ